MTRLSPSSALPPHAEGTGYRSEVRVCIQLESASNECLHPKAQRIPLVVLQEGGSPSARAEELQRSLQQELHAAKQQAATAAATRREAEQTLAELQAHTQEVARQLEAFKVQQPRLTIPNLGGGAGTPQNNG